MYIEILIPIILAVLAYILGRFRDNSKKIFDTKLDIYSDLTQKLNSYSFLVESSKVEFNEVKNLFDKVKNNEPKKSVPLNKKDIKEDIINTIERINNKFEKIVPIESFIKISAPVRLIGTKKIVKELREYHSLVTELLGIKDNKEKLNKLNKINECVMELEQLMRSDLLGFTGRYLSKKSIRKMLEKNQTKT